MKIAHFSDLHFCPAHLQEAERCFAFAVDQAIAAGVEAAVISGDSTDHALDMHAPAADALARTVRRLAEHCPVLMLQGTFSHEPPGTLNLFWLLGGRYPVHVSDRIEQVALTADGTWMPSKGWRFESLPEGTAALFSCLPTINKAAVAAAVGATEAASALGEQIAMLLRGFAPINRAARTAGVPTVGVSHGTVYGCVSEHGVPMAGFDHEFTTAALFAAEAAAFLLGHIHKHQRWEQDGRAIAYPGSIGRLHYGEQGEKGFLLWEIGAEGARFELVPTPAKRTIEISFEGRPDLEVLRTQADQAENTLAEFKIHGMGIGPRAVGSVGIDQVRFGPPRIRTAQHETAAYQFHSLNDFGNTSVEFMKIEPSDDGSREYQVGDEFLGPVRKDQWIGDAERREWDGKTERKEASTGRHKLRVRVWDVAGDWVAAWSNSQVVVAK